MGCGLTIENVDCRLKAVEAALTVAEADIVEIGAVLSGVKAVGVANALNSATAETIATVALTEGTWEVQGLLHLVMVGATTTVKTGSISATTNTDGVATTSAYNGIPTTTLTGTVSILTPTVQVIVPAAGVSRFLVANATFSAGTVSAYGHIRAVRVR